MASAQSSERRESAADIVTTPTRTAVADTDQDGSHSPGAQTPIRKMHLDTDDSHFKPTTVTGGSENSCCEVTSRELHPRAPPAVTPQACNVCLAEPSSKNRVLEYCGDYGETFLNLEISFQVFTQGQTHDVSFKPYQEAKQRAGSNEVFICRQCERQLRIACCPKKKERKSVEKVKRYIWNRLQSNQTAQNASLSDDQGTVVSKKCFLHTYASIDSRCVDPIRNLSCPVMLETRMKMGDTWKIEKWVTEFSKRMNIGTAVIEEIEKHARSVKLCQLHYSAMRNTMMTIEAEANSCSICGNSGDKRYAGEVMRFPYNELVKKRDLHAVVEDFLSLLTDNKLQTRDIKFICSPCRLVVLGRVSMREMHLRHRSSDNVGFDYGPTATVVLGCISYVREQLWEKKKMFVKMKEVHDLYLELVRTSGCHQIQQRAHRDVRTLRKYLQPPLAQTEIHLELGARKVGSFFCTLRIFRDIANNTKKPTVNSQAKSPKMDEQWIKEFALFISSRKDEIDKGEWNVAEYIRAVPKKMWMYDVAVHIGKSLAARCRAVAKIRNVNIEEEWPYNPQECPLNMHDLPQHEFSFALSTYYTIERSVYRSTDGRVRGPMYTSLSITSLTETTVSYMSYMNRISCMTSYQTVDVIRKNALTNRALNGPFGEAIPTAFHSVAFDNINVRTNNSLDVHGKSSHGFDGFASQLVDANPDFDFKTFCESRRKEELQPKKLKDVKREAFINEMCPGKNDPDLKLYNYIAAGLAVKNKRKLMSDEPKEQRSFRNIMLDAFKGFSGGKAKVVYVKVDRASAQDEITIVRELRKIEKQLARLSEEHGVHLVLAIVGDQPVFKMFFRLFYESYLSGTRLCQWMVPIQGGFHIDKQGIIATVKLYLAGSGFEELAEFSGLSKTQIENIIKYGNYKNNRRLLMQILVSMLMRLDAVCREEGGTEFSSALDALLREDIAQEARRARGEETEEDRKRRVEVLKELLPEGCELELSDSISPEVIKAGKMLCEEIESISKHSLNMKFYGECGVLNALLPWSAYNILTRRGQTKVLDKFWFKFAGLIHGTGKINYQENMFWYMFIKKVMPQVAYEILYDKGHLLMSMSDLPGSNLHLDEALEMGIIRHTKMLNNCVAEILERSPAFTMLVGRHMDTLERNLDPSRKRNTRNADLKRPTEACNEDGYCSAMPIWHVFRIFSCACTPWYRTLQYPGREPKWSHRSTLLVR